MMLEVEVGPDRGPLGSTDENCVTACGLSEAQESRRRAWRLRAMSAALLPGERVERCGSEGALKTGVGLTRRPDGGAGLTRVRRCGSVWVCPDCARKIAARRTVECLEAVKRWQGQGGHVYMFTFTLQHDAADELEALLSRLGEAMRWFWSGKGMSRWRQANGFQGVVRNLEVTWGKETGWHPHSHALVFVAEGELIDEAYVRSRWARAVERFGGYASKEHGLRVERVPTAEETLAARLSAEEMAARSKDPDKAARYIAKAAGLDWTAVHEVTWDHIKRARGGRFTPWELLAACDVRDGADRGAAPALWQTYAMAFMGRRHLYWSKGLRDKLGLRAEESDEQAAEAHDEEAVTVAVLPNRLYRRLWKMGKVLALLEHVEAHPAGTEVDQVRAFCGELGFEAGVVEQVVPPDDSWFMRRREAAD